MIGSRRGSLMLLKTVFRPNSGMILGVAGSPQGGWVDNVLNWDLRWRRFLFVWEAELLHELLAVLSSSREGRDDVWSWIHSPDGRYSVKSAYTFLSKSLQVPGAPDGETLQAVSQVWKSWAPSKVVISSWQLILDRILTRQNLVRRDVLLPDGGLECVFCGALSESSAHLFLSCPSLFQVWYQVARWLGWVFVPPLGLAQHLQAFLGLGRGKRVRLGLLLVWPAVIWTIWTSHNDLIFVGGTLREEPVVDRAKLLAWKWFLAKCPASSCSYHEWEVQPILCLIW